MKRNTKELSEFQFRNLKIIAQLLEGDYADEVILEHLHCSEVDYFTLLRKLTMLEQRMNIDLKTGLLKCRNDHLFHLIKSASRLKLNSSLLDICFIRFDIDNFSLINARYGHTFGDEILIRVAGILKDLSRPSDLIIRFGGEEFDVLLPSTDLQGGISYIQKIFVCLKNQDIRYEKNLVSVTMSAGVTSLGYNMEEIRSIEQNSIERLYQTLQMEADHALYEAKFLGKDRYAVYAKDKAEMYLAVREQYNKFISSVSH